MKKTAPDSKEPWPGWRLFSERNADSKHKCLLPNANGVICGEILTYRNTTSNFKNHLERVHPVVASELKANNKSNVGAWWKTHETIYPAEAALARRYLAIPATSAPSERLFSTGGRVIEKRRAALKPSSARAIIKGDKKLLVTPI